MQVASTKELQRVSDLVRSSLGLKKEKLRNQETRQNSLQQGLDWNDPEDFRNYVIYDKDSDSETLTAFFKISVDDSILVILANDCNSCWQSFNYLIEN